MVKPSSASRSPGVIWNSSSITAAVITLAPTATQAPWATWRRRSTAPALARNVMSAATSRIASNPSRSSTTDAPTDELAAGARTAQEPLRALEPREQARMDRVQLFAARPAGGAGPQGGECVLEVARERGIPGADVRLDLLESDVRVERQLARSQRHGGIDLTAHRREDRPGGRRDVVLPLGRGEHAQKRDEFLRARRVDRAREPRHRRAGTPPEDELHELVVAEARLGREVAQRRRPDRERGGERPVAAPRRAVARPAVRGVQTLPLALLAVGRVQRPDVDRHRPAVLG